MVTGVEMMHPDKGTEVFLYELGVRADARASASAPPSSPSWRARACGCYGMWVGTGEDNAAALATFEATGAVRESGATRILTWDLRTVQA